MKYQQEFRSLDYAIKKSDRVLLFAHTRPDPDTIGATSAMKRYIESLGKTADIACFDPFPKYLAEIFTEKLYHPDSLDITSYDAVIACDSAERGYDKIIPKVDTEKQLTVVLDHHHDVEITGDITINDSTEFSSTCELVYHFLISSSATITKSIATALLSGTIGDTGNFQHSVTSPRTLRAGSDLVRRGAPLKKIVSIISSSNNFSLLKLWGRAIERARIIEKTGMIHTAISQDDLEDLRIAPEDAGRVASFLITVPATKFALFAFQMTPKTVRCSLRSEKGRGVDVSAIAHRFGGGGHKLAAGFEIPGKIVCGEEGWRII